MKRKTIGKIIKYGIVTGAIFTGINYISYSDVMWHKRELPESFQEYKNEITFNLDSNLTTYSAISRKNNLPKTTTVFSKSLIYGIKFIDIIATPGRNIAFREIEGLEKKVNTETNKQ